MHALRLRGSLTVSHAAERGRIAQSRLTEAIERLQDAGCGSLPRRDQAGARCRHNPVKASLEPRTVDRIYASALRLVPELPMTGPAGKRVAGIFLCAS